MGSAACPGSCMGCPVGGGAKPLGVFVMGSSLDGLYSPPLWGPVFARALFDHWVGQACPKRIYKQKTISWYCRAPDSMPKFCKGRPCRPISGSDTDPNRPQTTQNIASTGNVVGLGSDWGRLGSGCRLRCRRCTGKAEVTAVSPQTPP